MGDYRISAITLEDDGGGHRTRAIEQEREVAIYDLLEANVFRPDNSPGGPYRLALRVEENRLAFDFSPEDGSAHNKVLLPMSAFRSLIKDYFLICDSYYKAIRTAPPSQIEALDMGRRALHNEGAELLKSRLQGKIETDFDTARRLFTLICVLHLRG